MNADTVLMFVFSNSFGFIGVILIIRSFIKKYLFDRKISEITQNKINELLLPCSKCKGRKSIFKRTYSTGLFNAPATTYTSASNKIVDEYYVECNTCYQKTKILDKSRDNDLSSVTSFPTEISNIVVDRSYLFPYLREEIIKNDSEYYTGCRQNLIIFVGSILILISIFLNILLKGQI